MFKRRVIGRKSKTFLLVFAMMEALKYILTKYKLCIILFPVNREIGGTPVLRKLGQNNQIALPKEVVKALHLNPNATRRSRS